MTKSTHSLSIVILVFLAGVLAEPREPRSFSETDYQNAFTEWVQTFSKAYTASQFFAKYAAFKENWDIIESWNARGSGHQLGANPFADITNAEYRKTYLGYKDDARLREEDFAEAFVVQEDAAQYELRAEKRSCASGVLSCSIVVGSSSGTLCCQGYTACSTCVAAYNQQVSTSTTARLASTTTTATTATTKAASTTATTATTKAGSTSTTASTATTATTKAGSTASTSASSTTVKPTTSTTAATTATTKAASTTTTTGTSSTTGTAGGVPASVDWRTSNVLTAIKDQGQCGSCWTFATTGSVEAAVAIKNGKAPVSLSEQNLVDCVTSSSGCDGGSFQSSFKYIITNKGIDTEASYPYKGVQGTCAYNAANVGATLTGTNGYVSVTANSESALQTAVAKQPVAVAIDAGQSSFQLYKSGVYSEPACSSTTLNHAVVAVGYGTDASAGDYWIVRNSWGTRWGISGYFLLQRGVNRCGVASRAAYPTA